MITPVNTWVCWYHSYVQSHHNTHTRGLHWRVRHAGVFPVPHVIYCSWLRDPIVSNNTCVSLLQREKRHIIKSHVKLHPTGVFVRVVHTLPCWRLDANMLTCCCCQDYSFWGQQEPRLMFRDVSTVMVQQVRVLLYWSTGENIPLILYRYV